MKRPRVRRAAHKLAILAVLSVMASLMVAPVPASAVTPCAASEFCVYRLDNRDSSIGWYGTGGSLNDYRTKTWWGASSITLDNRSESADNNGTQGYGVRIWTGYYIYPYTNMGTSQCISMGFWSELGTIGDNTASSHYWSTSC